jgi:type II secretory pathway pseudopilin PulG
MSKRTDFRPYGLTELLLLLAIAAILGFILVPRIHAYFYRLKAETVVARYLGALHTVQRSIRHTAAGSTVYFIQTHKHPGLFTSHKKLLRHAVEYAVGHRYTIIGAIYLSRSAYTLPTNVQFEARYFHQDSGLAFLYYDLFNVARPLKWPARELSGDAAQDARDTCKGYPTVVVLGMNFDYPARNKALIGKVSALLRKDGLKPRNHTVAATVNTQGAACNTE